MAEEKKYANEIMSEEELDGVAGGSSWEIQQDANRLRALGRLPNYRDVSPKEVNDALWKLGQDIGLKVGCEPNEGNKSNSYHIDHHKVSRDELWRRIDQKINGGYRGY